MCFVDLARLIYVLLFMYWQFLLFLAFKAIIPCSVCVPQITCQRINCSYAWENRHLFEVSVRFRHSSFACCCGVKVKRRTPVSWRRVHAGRFFFSFFLSRSPPWLQIDPSAMLGSNQFCQPLSVFHHHTGVLSEEERQFCTMYKISYFDVADVF